MNRILRRVPKNWEHPKKDDGRYQPMRDIYYGDILSEWLKNNEEWEKGTHPDLIENPELKKEYPFYGMYYGNLPDPEYYQIKKYSEEELTHIQLYETTSEGTPLTPIFKANELEKLCEYAAENCTIFANFKLSKEEWIKELSGNDILIP